MNFRKKIGAIHTNISGWTTDRKILVIESDDWGSLRMPNKEVYGKLLQSGIPVHRSAYCQLDTLESDEDIGALLDILQSVKNARGQSPKFTANFVVCNPDFLKIKESNLGKYYSEMISQTYKKSNTGTKVLEIFNEGSNLGLVKPQFHGKEHVNVPLWLQLLKLDKKFRLAFDMEVWGLSKDVFPEMEKSVQATYHSDNEEYIKESITTGLDIFERIFGFRSKSFIPNNNIFPKNLLTFLKGQDIEVIQGMKYLLSPTKENCNLVKVRRKFHRDDIGLAHLVRNCNFEPSELGTRYYQTFNEISMSFLLKKPAVISTHRINFVGGLSEKKRNQNLKEFELLLKSIIRKWPEIEFCFSDEVPFEN